MLVRPALALPAPSKVPASVLLSVMLQIGKLIQPNVNAVTPQLDQLDLKAREWLPPFEVKVSLSKEKFASGAFRDAYEATDTSGGLHPGKKYVLKKFKEEQTKEVHSIEDHTRKMAQTNSLARILAMILPWARQETNFQLHQSVYWKAQCRVCNSGELLEGDISKVH